MARLCGPGGLLFVPFDRSNLDTQACQPVLFASMPSLLLLRTGRAPSPCSVRAVEHLDVLPHARRRNATASEDVDSIVGDFVCRARGEHLEQTDGAGQVLVLVFVRQVAHLVGDVLQVVLDGFGVGDHLCEPRCRNVRQGKNRTRQKEWYFCLITGSSMSFLPNTLLWFAHFKHSSTTIRL